MAKRFTETTIWDEDWFVKLPPAYKLLWFYIKDKCNHAGIWKPNIETFQYFNQTEIDLSKALNFYNKGKERITILVSGHWLITDFFVFQYGNKFNIENKVHKSVYDIYLQEGAMTPLSRSIEGVKDKDKEKDKDKYINI
jgi:hypothetical protein